MPKQYTFMRVRPETNLQLNNKKTKMNKMLKDMGIKKKTIKMIDIMDMLSRKPIYLDAKELVELAKSAKKRI